jgi:hypothetical protein
MKKVFANIDSPESVSYMKSRYGSAITRVEMSSDTRASLLQNDFLEVAKWLNGYSIDIANHGWGIICGVVE